MPPENGKQAPLTSRNDRNEPRERRRGACTRRLAARREQRVRHGAHELREALQLFLQRGARNRHRDLSGLRGERDTTCRNRAAAWRDSAAAQRHNHSPIPFHLAENAQPRLTSPLHGCCSSFFAPFTSAGRPAPRRTPLRPAATLACAAASGLPLVSAVTRENACATALPPT